MKFSQLGSLVSMLAAFASIIGMVVAFSEFKYIGENRLLFLSVIASIYAAITSVLLARMRERRLRQRRIFIIYSRKDREHAEKIVQHLRSQGYKPWFDIDEITPGQKWSQAIQKGIGESAVALYLVSENLKAESKFVSEELKMAMSVMRSRDESFSPVIPVRLDNSEDIPPELADIQWVDLRKADGIGDLERGLERVLGHV